jgi:ribosomal protein L37E
MGIEDRDWWKDKENDKERKKLDNSSLFCRNCEGLTVNALTLICSSCGFDNRPFYTDRNPINNHPIYCTCVDCIARRFDNHPINCTCVGCTKKRLKKWGME